MEPIFRSVVLVPTMPVAHVAVIQIAPDLSVPVVHR
jgi:hypothetical protein